MPKKASNDKTTEATVQSPVTENNYLNDVDVAVEKRLVALYALQLIDSEIDKIQIIRGELPQAIEDLEDEITGLTTRLENYAAETQAANQRIAGEKNVIAESKERIKALQEQQNNVHNNREYDTINKELELRDLEIQLAERHIKDTTARLKEIEHHMTAAQTLIDERRENLQVKKDELDGIIVENEQEEKRLDEKSQEQSKYIEERYLTAYERIRKGSRNGLAVVKIDRDACGGCFSKIPPQRQMEIKMHKKVIVCEHCGRILVDDDIAAKADELVTK